MESRETDSYGKTSVKDNDSGHGNGKILRVAHIPGNWTPQFLYNMFCSYGEVEGTFIYDDKDENGNRQGLVELVDPVTVRKCLAQRFLKFGGVVVQVFSSGLSNIANIYSNPEKDKQTGANKAESRLSKVDYTVDTDIAATVVADDTALSNDENMNSSEMISQPSAQITKPHYPIVPASSYIPITFIPPYFPGGYRYLAQPDMMFGYPNNHSIPSLESPVPFGSRYPFMPLDLAENSMTNRYLATYPSFNPYGVPHFPSMIASTNCAFDRNQFEGPIKSPLSPEAQLTQIFVQNLDKIPMKNEKDLITLFEQDGEILEAKVCRDSDGKLRGYGFVRFADPLAAKNAISRFKNVDSSKELYACYARLKRGWRKENA